MRNIRFAHDPARPPTDIAAYEASVLVSVSDGMQTSSVATSQITVTITNLPPAILLGNDTTAEVVMRDSEPVIQVLQVGVDIIEDSDTISHITLTLTNPVHDSEQIFAVNGGSVSPSITVTNDTNSVTLTGPASQLEFIDALNRVEISYNYPAMDSILQGDVPDFTPRLVQSHLAGLNNVVYTHKLLQLQAQSLTSLSLKL